jgi:hypothetical protein
MDQQRRRSDTHVFRDGDIPAPSRNNSDDAGARLILLGAEILDERGDPEHHERQDDEANKYHCHRHPGRHCRHVHRHELFPEMRPLRNLQLATELRSPANAEVRALIRL